MSTLEGLLPATAFRREGTRVTLTPGTVEELATGLQWSRAQRTDVEVSRRRLSTVGAPDLTSCLIHVGAGAALQQVEQLLAAAGLTLGPLSPGALVLDVASFLEGRHAGLRAICGGRLETVALSLEAALRNGLVYRSHASPRSAAGPDLDFALLAGAGTVGLVSAATLRAQPLPTASEVVTLRLPSLDGAVGVLRRAMAHDAIPWTATLSPTHNGALLTATFRNLAFRAHRDARCLRELGLGRGGLSVEGAPAAAVEGPEQELGWEALTPAIFAPVTLYRLARESVIVAGATDGAGLALSLPAHSAAWLQSCSAALQPGALS
jgi:FAD/FMN-containing dehydrogenase